MGGEPSLLADKVPNQEKTTKSNSGQDTRERPQEHRNVIKRKARLSKDCRKQRRHRWKKLSEVRAIR